MDPLPSCASLARSGDAASLVRLVTERPRDATSKWAQAKDGGGVRAMHVAAAEGHVAFLEALVETKLDAHVNRADEDARTPVHWAAWRGHEEAVVCLLEMGASAQTPTRTGFTPLHYACVGGHANVARALVERGAKLMAMDESQQSPADVAKRFGHHSLHKWLTTEAVDVAARAEKATANTTTTHQHHRHDDDGREDEEEEKEEEVVNNLTAVVDAAVRAQSSVPLATSGSLPKRRKSGSLSSRLWSSVARGLQSEQSSQLAVAVVAAALAGVALGVWFGSRLSLRHQVDQR